MELSIALVSQKGGVGQTTLAVNLSYALAQRGWRVLLVDADPQGGVGFSLTGKSRNASGYFDLIFHPELRNQETLRQYILPTKLPQLSLLTRGSREAMDRLAVEPAAEWNPLPALRELEVLLGGAGFDLVIYDTPTGLSGYTLGLCYVVNAVLIPQQVHPLSLRSLPQVMRMIAAAKRADEGGGPEVAGIVLCRVEVDDPGTWDDQREFREVLPVEMILETVIPEHRDCREAGRAGVPVAMLRERLSPAALIFAQLAAELETRLALGGSVSDGSEVEKRYARLVD
jgi:chromosome partitioning protein